MMKKNFMYLMAAMMVAMLSVGFASCSSDEDDDEDGVVSANAIYGTWQLTHEEGYEEGRSYSKDVTTLHYYHIDKDGTCVEYRKDRDTGEWRTRDVSWYSLDIENKRIKLEYSDWDELITLTNNTMKTKSTWEYDGEEEWQIQTFTKRSDSVLDNLN